MTEFLCLELISHMIYDKVKYMVLLYIFYQSNVMDFRGTKRASATPFKLPWSMAHSCIIVALVLSWLW
jgi:hypothetical protein